MSREEYRSSLPDQIDREREREREPGGSSPKNSRNNRDVKEYGQRQSFRVLTST